MALSPQDTRLVLKRLADKAFQTSQERDQLLAQLATAEELKAKDLAWMLFRPDRAYRDAVLPILKRLSDPETADAVIGESRGKPEAAVRAAAAALFSLAVPGTERRLAEIAVQGKGEGQEIARRLLLDAPMSPPLESLLWQLASTGRIEERVAFLARLATQPPDAKSLPRWQRLARDPDKALRERALAVLAQHDAGGSVDLFVEHLPLVDYSTQQVLVEALTRAAASQGPAFADRLLPLVASGDAPTRTAVLKILLGHARPARRRAAATSRSPRASRASTRDRALESMRAFGNELIEPTIELLSDPDEDVRGCGDAGGAVVRRSARRPRHDHAAQGPRLVDPHHRGRDARPAQGPARRPSRCGGARRSRDALGGGRGARPHRRPRALSALSQHAAGPGAQRAHRGDAGARNFKHPQVLRP